MSDSSCQDCGGWMLQSPEVRRLRICLHSATCPSHPCIRQCRRRSRDHERICNCCSSALPISDLEWASPIPHPCISSSDEGESQQLRRRASCDSFRKKGCRDFGLKDVGARTPTIRSPAATYADTGPSRCRSAQVQAHKRRPLAFCWAKGAHRDDAAGDMQSICGVARQ